MSAQPGVQAGASQGSSCALLYFWFAGFCTMKASFSQWCFVHLAGEKEHGAGGLACSSSGDRQLVAIEQAEISYLCDTSQTMTSEDRLDLSADWISLQLVFRTYFLQVLLNTCKSFQHK